MVQAARRRRPTPKNARLRAVPSIDKKVRRARPAPSNPKVPVAKVALVKRPTSLRDQLGYTKEDLAAATQVGFEYCQAGGWDVAREIFTGLAAIEPNNSYHALALGLACDRLGNDDDALAAYRKAAQLDPKDPRPEINRAELHLKNGQRELAARVLSRGLKKAKQAGEAALLKKAASILAQIKK